MFTDTAVDAFTFQITCFHFEIVFLTIFKFSGKVKNNESQSGIYHPSNKNQIFYEYCFKKITRKQKCNEKDNPQNQEFAIFV